MILRSRFLNLLIAGFFVVIGTGSVSAKSLIGDLSSLNLESLDRQKWQVTSSKSDALTIDCTSCENQILVNVLLGGRELFGPLGNEKAKKAKENCLNSSDDSLQCNTIEGFEMGAVSGLISTVKISEDFFVSSYILGDETTLIQIRAKAASSEMATSSVKSIYKALEKEIIVK